RTSRGWHDSTRATAIRWRRPVHRFGPSTTMRSNSAVSQWLWWWRKASSLHDAMRIHVDYERECHATDLKSEQHRAYKPKERMGIPLTSKPRGDADRAFAAAAVQVEAEYRTPIEHHNPM